MTLFEKLEEQLEDLFEFFDRFEPLEYLEWTDPASELVSDESVYASPMIMSSSS